VIRDAFFLKIPAFEVLNDEETKVALCTEKIEIIETRKPLYLFMVVPLAITALFSILFCLFPNIFGIYDLATTSVNNIFGGM